MKRSWLPAAGVALACAACFSTTRPEVETPTAPGASGTWVRGKVVRRLAIGEYRNALDWGVQVRWYGADLNRDGAPDLLLRTVAQTNRDGAYAVPYRDARDPVRVEVRAVRCDYDQDSDMGRCCIDSDACSSSCPDPWHSPRSTTVRKNATVQIDLVVNCAAN